MGNGTSARGAATRARIRETAMAVISERGEITTVAELAARAGVFPNQITHHFGSKDRLFAEAAFALLLRDTNRLRDSVRRMRTPDSFRTALARTALSMPSLPFVVEAITLARNDAELRPQVRRAIGILFRKSETYLERVLAENTWSSEQGIKRDVATFWSTVFGAVLISGSGFPGGPSDIDLAGSLSVIAD